MRMRSTMIVLIVVPSIAASSALLTYYMHEQNEHVLYIRDCASHF
jgi:hypothetical protein